MHLFLRYESRVYSNIFSIVDIIISEKVALVPSISLIFRSLDNLLNLISVLLIYLMLDIFLYVDYKKV